MQKINSTPTYAGNTQLKDFSTRVASFVRRSKERGNGEEFRLIYIGTDSERNAARFSLHKKYAGENGRAKGRVLVRYEQLVKSCAKNHGAEILDSIRDELIQHGIEVRFGDRGELLL